MKVIFSRKGFDSAAGGCPSPIIDGRPVSLPIPTRQPTPVRFRDLAGNIGELVEQLSGRRVDRDRPCHLDPDLDGVRLARRPGWKGALGQAGAAASHLRNQNVGPCDLFLFWGLFRPAKKQGRVWSYEGHGEHRIFGWLQVAEILAVNDDPGPVLQRYPWLADHPHAQDGWKAGNTVYVASDALSLGPANPLAGCRSAGHLPDEHSARAGPDAGLPGWGVFEPGCRLTRNPAESLSRWSIPDWLNPERGGVGMTYHPPNRWSADGTVRAAARGQEFVANTNGRADAIQWLRNLFESSHVKPSRTDPRGNTSGAFEPGPPVEG